MTAEPNPRAVSLLIRQEDGRSWPVLSWLPPSGWRAISSSVVGGGIDRCHWWLNAMVSKEYHRPDPEQHVLEIAEQLGLPSGRPGVGMLTAADVGAVSFGADGGVQCWATVGLGWPVWAAASDQHAAAEDDAREPSAGRPPTVGTINVLLALPVPLSDAALVNAVVTATEAKTQALVEAGIPGSGTSSDAICIACPEPDAQGRGNGQGAPDAALPEPYAGPRSLWGARLARAVHTAVGRGTEQWVARNGRPDRFVGPST